MMTKQQAFDKAYSGVIAQGCKATVDGECALRTDNGSRCNIGHVLTDEDIAGASLNQFTNVTFTFTDMGGSKFFGECDLYFLQRLQGAHDTCRGGGFFLADYQRNMSNVAFQFNLKVPA